MAYSRAASASVARVARTAVRASSFQPRTLSMSTRPECAAAGSAVPAPTRPTSAMASSSFLTTFASSENLVRILAPRPASGRRSVTNATHAKRLATLRSPQETGTGSALSPSGHVVALRDDARRDHDGTMLRTPLCDLLGIEVPIICAPFGPWDQVELAAA